MKKKELEKRLERLVSDYTELSKTYQIQQRALIGAERAIENGTRFGLAQRQSIEDLVDYVFDLEKEVEKLRQAGCY